MSTKEIKNELKNLFNSNKEYLATIGLTKRKIMNLLKLGFSIKSLLNVIKKNLAKHDSEQNEFNQVSNEIIEEYENLNNPFNEELIMNQLKEIEKNLSINDIETQIKTFNPDKNTLQINFKHGSKTLFKDVKKIISDKVNEFQGVKQVYLQMFFKIGDSVKFRNYSLNEESGFKSVMSILNAEPFDLTDDLIKL